MAISLTENFYKEQITSDWTTGGGNFYISELPANPSGFLVISPNNPALREVVRYTAIGTDGGGNFVTIAVDGRGLGNTNDVVHITGEPVFINVTAQHLEEIDAAIEAINTNGALDASDTTKGVSKLSVPAADPADPVAVGDNDPRIPGADVAAALVGTQSAPSATNRFITEETLWKEFDQEQAVQDASIQCGQADTTGNRNKVVQSFVPTFDKIRGTKLNKQADTGTFTGDVIVELFADDSGDPDTTVLATKTIANADWLKINAGEFEVVFDTEYGALVVGDLYWLSVRTSTADNANYINLGTDSGASYTDGEMKFNNTTDGFVAQAADLYFRTLRGITGLILGQVIQEFNADGTWNKFDGATLVQVEVWGAGGGGGNGASGNSPDGGGSGGGGGAYNRVLLPAKLLSDTVAVTVGVGGSAGAAGTDSLFGDLVAAYGGGAGIAADNSRDYCGGAGGGQLSRGSNGARDDLAAPSNASPGGAPTVGPYISGDSGGQILAFLDNTGFGGGSGNFTRPGNAYFGGGAGSGRSQAAGSSVFGGGGGGGGGNSSSTSAGEGGSHGTFANGGGGAAGSGATGVDGADGEPFHGGGGGTGGAAGVTGGNGGNGGTAAGGGGGGGYDTDLGGGSRGLGGRGGDGLVRVTTFF